MAVPPWSCDIFFRTHCSRWMWSWRHVMDFPQAKKYRSFWGNPSWWNRGAIMWHVTGIVCLQRWRKMWHVWHDPFCLFNLPCNFIAIKLPYQLSRPNIGIPPTTCFRFNLVTSEILHSLKLTWQIAPKNGWLEYFYTFLLFFFRPIFRCVLKLRTFQGSRVPSSIHSHRLQVISTTWRWTLHWQLGWFKLVGDNPNLRWFWGPGCCWEWEFTIVDGWNPKQPPGMVETL